MRKIIKSWGYLASMIGFLAPVHAQAAPGLASLGSGTHIYLRCESTGWQLNEESRLKASELEFLRELTFDVNETSMLSAGDDCVLTETPELNAADAWQKNYGGDVPLLRVPESSYLLGSSEPNDNLNFTLRFPALGRYRFSLNTRDSYFSIKRDAAPQPGEVAWTLPSFMLPESHGRLFLISYTPQYSLALVDKESGLPVWTYESDDFITYDGCATAETILVRLNGRVAALSLQTGREVWSENINGTLPPIFSVQCDAGQNKFYISYGGKPNTFVSLDLTTGKPSWTRISPDASFRGMDEQRIFMFGSQYPRSTFTALDKRTGAELWKAEAESGAYSLSNDGEVFRLSSSKVEAISPDDGTVLWTYKAIAQEYPWLMFEHDGFYIRGYSRISSVDKKTGQVLWSYIFDPRSAPNPSAKILKSGVVWIQGKNYTAGVSDQLGLDSATGKVLWKRKESGTNTFLHEDESSGVWLFNDKNFSAMDPWTGNLRWSHTLDSTEPLEKIIDVMERDPATVYVAYGISGERMGVLALDVTNGQVKWKTMMDGPTASVGMDSQSIFLNKGYLDETGDQIGGSAAALRK